MDQENAFTSGVFINDLTPPNIRVKTRIVGVFFFHLDNQLKPLK